MTPHRRMGRGGTVPPNFLRSGRNPCVIRAKYKNFGKIMLCPEKRLYVFENYRYIGNIFLLYPEIFLYVCEKYGILGKIFWYVRKNFVMFAKITVYYGKFFGYLPPLLAKNFGEKY